MFSLIRKPAALPFKFNVYVGYFRGGFRPNIKKLYQDKVIYGKISLQRVRWTNQIMNKSYKQLVYHFQNWATIIRKLFSNIIFRRLFDKVNKC